MRKYAYKAMDSTGRSVEGQIEAPSTVDVDQFFLEQNLTPLKVTETGGNGGVFDALNAFLYTLRRKLLETELIAFTRQFAAAYGAGLPVPRILAMLGNQMTHRTFREALVSISDQIQTGKGLTEAFTRFPDIFDPTYLAILSSGEVSGNLDAVMNYSAGLLEKKMIHNERIKSTLLYPKLVVVAIIFTIVIMLIFVIPQFQNLYERFGSNLPLPTMILVNVSKFVVSYWWVGLLSLIPGFYLEKHLREN